MDGKDQFGLFSFIFESEIPKSQDARFHELADWDLGVSESRFSVGPGLRSGSRDPAAGISSSNVDLGPADELACWVLLLAPSKSALTPMS